MNLNEVRNVSPVPSEQHQPLPVSFEYKETKVQTAREKFDKAAASMPMGQLVAAQEFIAHRPGAHGARPAYPDTSLLRQ